MLTADERVILVLKGNKIRVRGHSRELGEGTEVEFYDYIVVVDDPAAVVDCVHLLDDLADVDW